jgi:hypothetical protein
MTTRTLTTPPKHAPRPAEILAAQRGHIAKLKAVHGTTEDTAEHGPREEITPEQVRDGIAKLKTLAGKPA